MIKKAMVVTVAILASAALIFAGNAGHTNIITNPNPQNAYAISSHQTTAIHASKIINSQIKISPAKAKKIAQKHIEEPRANAGKPKLIKIEDKYVYNIPVILKMRNVGYFYIDANTGKVIEGAGGAPLSTHHN